MKSKALLKSFFPLLYPKDNFHFFVSIDLDVLEVIVLWSTWSQVELGHLWKWARLQTGSELSSKYNHHMCEDKTNNNIKIRKWNNTASASTTTSSVTSSSCWSKSILGPWVAQLSRTLRQKIVILCYDNHSKGLPVWSLCRWWGPSRGRLWREVPHLC